jgi:hypothetical protein
MRISQGDEEMLRYALVIGPLLISTSALSDGKDASYYCTDQLATGLAFNLQTKQWKETSLSPKQAFVLRMQYLGDNNKLGTNVQRYSVTITQHGSNYALKCSSTDKDAAIDEVNVYSKENIECWDNHLRRVQVQPRQQPLYQFLSIRLYRGS